MSCTPVSGCLSSALNCLTITYVVLLCTWPLFQNEPDCPDYPTERYTVDVDGVQVADLTADAVQSLAINHANGSVTLSLPLSQPLPENAVTLNMTKYNTVPTNRSDVTGNIVTEMVTWGTSSVFGELELITVHWNWREVTCFTVLQLFLMMHVRMYYIIELLYQLRLLTWVYVISNLCIRIILYRQCMHDVFHSFLSTSPSPSRVTTWWGATSCSEWWRWLAHEFTVHCALKCTCNKLWIGTASHIHIPSHVLYTCAGDIYHYLLCMYMGHTDLYLQLT